MARATTLTPHARNSRTANKTDRANSPFSHRKGYVRREAAERMVAQRRRQLARLKADAERCTDPHDRRNLATRIAGVRNNLASWVKYLADNYPKVDGAVMRP
jgi:hypothetical protein